MDNTLIMLSEKELLNVLDTNDFTILAQKCRINEHQLDFCFKYAVTNSYENAVKLLLNNPNINPAMEKNYAIKTACKNGNIAIVEMLLIHDKINPGIDYNYPIKICVDNNQIDILKLLLADDRTDVTDAHNTAFILSIKLKHVEIMKIIMDCLEEKKKNQKLEDELSPSSEAIGLTDELLHEALIIACEYANLEIVKILYNKLPNTAEQYNRINEILCSAVKYDNIKIVSLLLTDWRANPKHNKSVMVRYAKTKPMLALLEKSIKKNEIMNSDLTPEEVAQKLIQYGHIDVNNKKPTSAKFKVEGTRRIVVLEFEF